MRSGNGRHRRPRQAPAVVVAAGVTGSALALPLLGAGSASAADAATWDRVAACESGGQWSAHFGNGRYGGLQFTQESWERHGGLAYAPSADLASRAQQIAVAEKALAAGDTQWATCAPIAGLTNDGVKPEVAPELAVTPAPTGPLPESNWIGGLPTIDTPPEALAPEAERTPSPSAPSSAPSTTPSTTATPEASVTAPAPGTGKHRGEAAPEETGKPGEPGKPGDSGKPLESGRHASPSDVPTPDATAPEKVANPDSAGAEGSPGNTPSKGISDAIGEYTVKPGDNLTEIAEQNELPGGWGALYDANRATVGQDPNLILPGQSLDLTIGKPAEADAK